MLICYTNLLIAFNQIIYESTADTRNCKRTSFLDFVLRDFVPINRTIHTSNVDKSYAAFTSQKEQNYLWLPF